MNLERLGKLRAHERQWQRMCASGYSQVYRPRPMGAGFAHAIYAAMAFAFFCALSACGVVAGIATAFAYVLTFLGARP